MCTEKSLGKKNLFILFSAAGEMDGLAYRSRALAQFRVLYNPREESFFIIGNSINIPGRFLSVSRLTEKKREEIFPYGSLDHTKNKALSLSLSFLNLLKSPGALAPLIHYTSSLLTCHQVAFECT